jgi:hypothetical protein
MKKKMKIVPDRDDKNFCSMMCDYYEENRCLLFDKPIICGTVIHKEKDMELFSIKNFDVNILKVKCPTTKSQ